MYLSTVAELEQKVLDLRGPPPLRPPPFLPHRIDSGRDSGRPTRGPRSRDEAHQLGALPGRPSRTDQAITGGRRAGGDVWGTPLEV